MKRLIINFILILFLILVTLIITLSTIGIQTERFNKLIIERAAESKNINLKLNAIKFKIDPKKISLYLETPNPKIIYRDISIPVRNIKVYIDFVPILRSDFRINKISLNLKELDIIELNKLTKIIKPSNFKSLLNNKIKEGKLISDIDIFLDEKGSFKNFIAKGTVKDLKIELIRDLNFTKTNLSFFADSSDVLIQNIFGDLEGIKISDGDIKLNLEDGIKINSNLNSKIYFDQELLNKYSNLFKKYSFANDVKSLNGNLTHNLYIDFDKTYKVKDYNYKISGKQIKSRLELLKPIKNSFINEKIKNIYLSDLNIQTTFTPKTVKSKVKGKYSFNNLDYLNLNLEQNFENDLLNIKLDLDYKNDLELFLINYKKSQNSVISLSLDLEKIKNSIKINKLYLSEGDNSIKVENLRFNEKEFLSFEKINVITQNNNFLIQNDKKIFIVGSKFDATNLIKFLNNQAGKNKFDRLNNKIEIDFKHIKLPVSKKIKNFKLIGEIKNGKFIKISSKGDYGENNFLDISMKKDKNTDKKYLEIYSDLTKPLLTEYSFFKGLSGGKLLFTSIIDGPKSNSKLKIENFKVSNAPGVIKLLSLADLGGLADLAKGEGLSFDVLEIDMEKNENFLRLNEILALGPSMSVLMEGFKDQNGVTSLRGTLVPAKTLNKLISKIPIIGNIIIPKEVGEGLFGISFKMKGPKGKIKTTINPIRTLTPRFIQKIVDRKKETK